MSNSVTDDIARRMGAAEGLYTMGTLDRGKSAEKDIRTTGKHCDLSGPSSTANNRYVEVHGRVLLSSRIEHDILKEVEGQLRRKEGGNG